MIYKGDDTPYAVAEKNKIEDLMLSDAQLNITVSDFVASNAEMGVLLQTVHTIATTYSMDDESKIRLIKNLTDDYAKG